ncbi:Protein of unknown function [Pyronema omphalodes CBS 100304]|uniref:Uncharacterized protein n=1 Tax=Pyronema omphalodes (strain CBS 100304) TaxID=1076935 RepID=U4KVU6_PYROM|nr:Protein of unknown function [Pyronema omphalodes CBS 100304]
MCCLSVFLSCNLS